MKFNISFEKIFQEDQEKEEETTYIKALEENESIKENIKKHEIKDFLDTFNFNGMEYEIHSQILLAQILKCYEEEEENSFKFLRNIKYKLENIDPNTKTMEFDFIINNLDVKIFKKFINYLSKNILILNFRGNIYEIKNKTDFSDINFELEKDKKYDILGEIGLNAIDDQNKVDQFIKYSELLRDLNNSNKKFKDKIDLFYEKTGFSRENEKILFFVTNSKFNEVYKYLKVSKLYNQMKKININFVLCYLSVGLNERIILSNFLIDVKNKEETDLLNKIKISNDGFIKSEKFKKLCYKLNDLLSGINQIKTKFYEKEKEGLSYIMKTWSYILSQKELVVIENLENKIDLPIRDLLQNKKEIEICLINLKSGYFIKDDIEEKLKLIKVNITTIYLNSNEEITKNIIDDLKKKHKFEKIYFFICNYKFIVTNKLEDFVNKIITKLKICKTNYIFLYNAQEKEVKNCKYNQTLFKNIFIANNENQLIEQLKNTIDKIKLNSNDLNKIFIEKKYYDRFIKIYLEKTRKKILNSSSSENDFLKKSNEILNFMSNLDFSKNIPDKIDNNTVNDLLNLINETVNNYINKEYKEKIETVFNELSKFFKSKIELLNSSKEKTINFCRNFLIRSTFNYIYDFFIIDAIPKISFNIYNRKIETYFEGKKEEI